MAELHGVCAKNVYESHDRDNCQIFRRVSEKEKSVIGDARDVRGTDEEKERIKKLIPALVNAGIDLSTVFLDRRPMGGGLLLRGLQKATPGLN